MTVGGGSVEAIGAGSGTKFIPAGPFGGVGVAAFDAVSDRGPSLTPRPAGMEAVGRLHPRLFVRET